MKIIHVCRGEFNPNSLNGVYKVIDSISKELTAHNHEVCVLSVSDSTASLYVPSEERYEHVRVKEWMRSGISIQCLFLGSYQLCVMSKDMDAKRLF